MGMKNNIKRYKRMQQEFNILKMKKIDFDIEISEHKLVLNTIKNMDYENVGLRLVGDYLIQRTIGEIIPALRKNIDKLQRLIKAIALEIEKRQKDIFEYQNVYKF